MAETLYYWAWWVNIDPATGRLSKGIWGYKLSEGDLVSAMSSRGMSRNEYEVYATSHYGESQVKHEINDLIAEKVKGQVVRPIDKAIQARYRKPVDRKEVNQWRKRP